jgi:YVTN family beta-propeller protein
VVSADPIGKFNLRSHYIFLAFFILLFLLDDIAYANTVTATITVGTGPVGVGVDSDSNLIYVSNQNANTVSVIDGTTNMVTATINVGTLPYGVGVDSDSNLIYVANRDADTVSVIDGTTNMVTATITVGTDPRGVGVDSDSNLIYVANRVDDNVSVIDGTTNMVTATITVGNGPLGVGVDSDSNLIYVSNNLVDNTVSVIDGTTNMVTATINVGDVPIGVAVDSDSNLIYVGNFNDNTVSVIDSDVLPSNAVSSNNGGSGDGRHQTAPTSGLDWNTFEQIVKGGFTVNGKSIDITDNWHTDFEKQSLLIGKINSFGIKTHAQNNGLLFQEIAFGIPAVGEYQNAEAILTVWYNHDKSIKDVTVEQDRHIIDSTSLQVLTSQIPCGYIDSACYQTDIYAIFNEPLQYDVFAIKAVDMSRRSMMPTYLNEGLDISGYSLNPLATKEIPDPYKYEGLITVTQLHPLSNLWGTENGRIFEMFGESNSFKLIYELPVREYYDQEEVRHRTHDFFNDWKLLQSNKAKFTVFNSDEIQSEFPNSFAYEYPEIDSRTQFLIDHNLLNHTRK